MGNKIDTEGMSLSKQRKLQKKAEMEKQKRQSVINKIVLAAVAVLVIGLIAWEVAQSAIKKANSVTADSNYSAQIDDNGMITGVVASDYVSLPDYANATAALSDIEYSDESIESDIATVLANNKYLDSSEELVAAIGDTVSIDYVGNIDGVEFDGGSDTNHELELGSNSFIDDFEDQIAGHTPGEVFDVDVTFPEDYSNNEDLAGCDATFTVTLNGIYVTPEFTDEFVEEHLSEYASTVEEYRQYLKDSNYETNLSTYTKNYLIENTTLKSTPSAYLKKLKANYKASEVSYYEYLNSLYSTYYGSEVYSTFADYLTETYSMTEDEYDASLGEQVNENLIFTLSCQAVAEAEGITATIDEVREKYLAQGNSEENFDSQLETYGTGYLVQQLLCDKVIETVRNMITVE